MHGGWMSEPRSAIFRYADRGGRPLSNFERCNRHTREALQRDQEAGTTIYDERER